VSLQLRMVPRGGLPRNLPARRGAHSRAAKNLRRFRKEASFSSRVQDWSIPLVVAAAAFLAVLLWRVRPAVPWGGERRALREALRDARQRIESASSETERAVALCDAADLLARRLGGRAAAKGMYLRALRADPKSVQAIERAVAGLSRRPRALESLLWRSLGAAPWNESPATTRAALDALKGLYEGPLKNGVKARAMANARDALDGER